MHLRWGLRTNVSFFSETLILKRGLSFESLRYCTFFKNINNFRPSQISTKIQNSTMFIFRDAHVKTPLRCASTEFLTTNIPFLLRRDFPFDSFRYMLSKNNFFRPSEILTRIINYTILIIFTFFGVSIFTQITNCYVF